MKIMIDIPDEAYKFIIEHGIQDTAEIDRIIEEGKPVMTGEWIDRNGNTTYPFWLRYECSICHGHSGMADYCYHCGAKMKGEEE